MKLMKKLVAVLVASLMCTSAFATTSGTVIGTTQYSANGMVLGTQNPSTGEWTRTDIQGRTSQMGRLDSQGRMEVTTISYNFINEPIQYSTLRADGSTSVTLLSAHGAVQISATAKPPATMPTNLTGMTPEQQIATLAAAGLLTGVSVTAEFMNSPAGASFLRALDQGSHQASNLVNQMRADGKLVAGSTINFAFGTDGKTITADTTITTKDGTTTKYGFKSGFDPLVAGTVVGVKEIDGKKYLVVKADTVDMFDGNGAQAADGEEIYVAVDDATYADISGKLESSNGQPVSICIAGNVSTSPDGVRTMTMNEGGYEAAVGASSQEVAATWKANNQSFYSSMVNQMAPVWEKARAAGVSNDWKAGWNFLVGMLS